MRTSFLTLFCLLLFIGATSWVSNATSSSSSMPTVSAGSYVGYSPASFTVIFPQTNQPNVTVHSLANGLFTYTVSTTSPYSHATISMNSSDVYDISLALFYSMPISGNITWTLISTGLPVGDSGTAEFTNQSTISLSWQITLFVYQQYPSANQIANATSGVLINYDQQKIALLQQEANANQAADNLQFEIQDMILGVTVVFMVLASIYLFRSSRRNE
jgi:hypothetical protein